MEHNKIKTIQFLKLLDNKRYTKHYYYVDK